MAMPSWEPAFRKALDGPFDAPSIALLVADFFPGQTSFANISDPGFNKPFAYRLYELTQYAFMNDWLLDLVAAARERRPKNAGIAKVAETVGLAIAGPRLDNPTGMPLEALINANAQFIDPTAFREGLGPLEGQVCWVDVPGGGGTGFLVGPDLVLTNQHVIAPVAENKVNWKDVRCRFDYRQGIGGEALGQKKVTEVKLHATKWLEHSLPPSQFDWDPTLGEAGPREVDCALLRLEEAIGDDPVGGPTADASAKPRGWIDHAEAAAPLVAGNLLFILQHPEGEPLRLTVGTVTQFNSAGTRVRYDANSKNGSSGAPCFNADLKLVALHHAHDLATPPKWNQGIPLASLQKVWSDDQIVFD